MLTSRHYRFSGEQSSLCQNSASSETLLPLEIGHLFKLVAIHSNVFTGSRFDAQQSYRWLKYQFEGYDKPFVIVTPTADLATLSAMISLVGQFDQKRMGLAVVSAKSVTFRGSNQPITIESNFWEALKQRYQLQEGDQIRTLNWVGLRMGQNARLSTYIQNGWPTPDKSKEFNLIKTLLTDKDSQNPD